MRAHPAERQPPTVVFLLPASQLASQPAAFEGSTCKLTPPPPSPPSPPLPLRCKLLPDSGVEDHSPPGWFAGGGWRRPGVRRHYFGAVGVRRADGGRRVVERYVGRYAVARVSPPHPQDAVLAVIMIRLVMPDASPFWCSRHRFIKLELWCVWSCCFPGGGEGGRKGDECKLAEMFSGEKLGRRYCAGWPGARAARRKRGASAGPGRRGTWSAPSVFVLVTLPATAPCC